MKLRSTTLYLRAVVEVSSLQINTRWGAEMNTDIKLLEHQKPDRKKTTEIEARNEKQTSETQEKNRRTPVRCDSMNKLKPNFSRDPDGSVKCNSGEHITSLREQWLKTTAS